MRAVPDKEDIEFLKTRVLQDDPLIEIFRKLIKDAERGVCTPPPHEDNWLVKRSYADGQLKELAWMKNFKLE
jgi:hypothetical protein